MFATTYVKVYFFKISVVALKTILPSLVTGLGLDKLRAASLIAFLPLNVLTNSLVFNPVMSQFKRGTLLIPDYVVMLLKVRKLTFFRDIPLLRTSVINVNLNKNVLGKRAGTLMSSVSKRSRGNSHLDFLNVFCKLNTLNVPVLLNSLSERCSFRAVLLKVNMIVLTNVVFYVPMHFPTPGRTRNFPMGRKLKLLGRDDLLLLDFVLFFRDNVRNIYGG